MTCASHQQLHAVDIQNSFCGLNVSTWNCWWLTMQTTRGFTPGKCCEVLNGMIWKQCFWFYKILSSGSEAYSREDWAFTPYVIKTIGWLLAKQWCPWDVYINLSVGGNTESNRPVIWVVALVSEKHAAFALMLIRKPSDSLPWLSKGRAGRKSAVIMFLKKKKMKGELNSVIGTFL